MIQIDWLYTELGIPQPTLDELPSPSGPTSISADPFLSISTSHSTPTPSSGTKNPTPLLFAEESPGASHADYQQIFTRFAARIEEAEDETLSAGSTVPIGLENVEPTQGLIAWANSTRASLEEIKKRREAHIQAMYDQLESLWRRLGVSEGDMDLFVEAHRGSTEETVREYEEELERMLELKRERMGAFIESARGEILRLWDDLMIGDEERADFAPFADGESSFKSYWTFTQINLPR
jgi:protein regulator of cytokinesis 1